MQIENSVALVTGANRGLGKAFVDELLRQGARKVYAAARQPTSSDDRRVVPLRLDITDARAAAHAAEAAADVTLVVNNTTPPAECPDTTSESAVLVSASPDTPATGARRVIVEHGEDTLAPHALGTRGTNLRTWRGNWHSSP